jgi:lipopolysaccharide biosynthesis glycosyltransferase
VASIRFYYPDIKIHLIKDEHNGNFSTREIEKNWNVQLIHYPRKRFGWAAAKMHFYCDERFADKKFLLLDSDIVFIGKLLDQDFVQRFEEDVIVSEETSVDPQSSWFTNTYFSYNLLKSHDCEYQFEGYSFNSGQMFCKGNLLKKDYIVPYFDFDGAPSWKRMDLFPLVDQSLLNYLLPKLSRQGDLKVGRRSFMLWFDSEPVKRLNLDSIIRGSVYPYVIHWAGALRTPYLRKMKRGDILLYFEKKYYSSIRFGFLLQVLRKVRPVILFYAKTVYYKIKGSSVGWI